MKTAQQTPSWVIPYLDPRALSVSHWGAAGQLWVRIAPPPPDPADLATHSTLVPHDVPMMFLRSIGRGGMGAVLQVFDTRRSDGGIRVCKVKDPNGDPDRFEEEIRLLQKMQNPHVVRCFGAAEIILPQDISRVAPSVTLPAFFMEYIEGGSLRDLLKSKRGAGSRCVPIREAFRMTGQIVDALDALHRTGVIHRDMKPENVLLDIAHGRAVRICDLGIARQQSPGNLAAPATLSGTPGYNAPEIFAGAPAGPAADYFAVGCMLLEMLTGQQAFTSKSAHQIARLRMTTDLNPPGHLLDAVERNYGVETRTLIDDLLKKQPADRLCDPAKIRSRIEGILVSNLKLGTSLWQKDWPAYDRDTPHLIEFVGEEKSWFKSGKLSWAGCLIGLHGRRRALSDFGQIIEELCTRLFLIATPLEAAAERSAVPSAEKLKLTIEESQRDIEGVSDWLTVLLNATLRKNLAFLADDKKVLADFDRVVTHLQRQAMRQASVGTDQTQRSSLTELMTTAGRSLDSIRSCWGILLQIKDRVHDNIADCSDQLVAAVARIK